MPSASYSFLDVAALDSVRERFASGDALAILSSDLDELIWTNGPGAELFGYSDIEATIGASARFGMTTKRQISATRGFPAIGRDRPVQVRMTTGLSSRMVSFLASSLVLPDGETAILLAAPAPTGGARSARDIAERAIGGFAEAGHFVAFIDGAGEIEAASPGFGELGLARQTLADMAEKATGERRIVKQMIPGRRGPLPAGLARLTDARSLVVVVDEASESEEETTAAPTVESVAAAPVPDEQPILQTEPEPVAPAEEKAGSGERPTPVHDNWYFSDATAKGDANAGEPHADARDVAPVESEPDAGEQQAPDEPDASDDAEAPAPATAEPVASTDEPAIVAEDATRAPDAASTTNRPAGPVRFVWRTDAEGKFSQISPEFAQAVGDEAADIVGRTFEDVARVFGLDPSGDIAGLLARRDTWSGRSVMWPVSGTDLSIPVDLAALPVYDRNRAFEGFRGFGVARTGDASVDPQALGLVLTRSEPDQAEVVAEAPPAPPTESIPDKPSDPFQGEVPALSIVPAQDRRFTDKIIRLAEHRPVADNDKGLSSGERIAFQQIGERLKKDTGSAGSKDELADQPPPAPEQESPATASDTEEPVADDSREVEDLRLLDGAEASPEDAAPADANEAAKADQDDTETTATASTESAETEAPSEPPAPEAGAAKPSRPGMSLLDFAQWDNGSEAEASSPTSEEEADVSQENASDPETDPVPEDGQMPAPGVARDSAGWRKFKLVELEQAASLDEPQRASGEAKPLSDDGGEQEAAPDVAAFAGQDTSPEPAAPDDVAHAPATDTPPQKSGTGLSILEKLPVPVLVHSGDTLHYANDEFLGLTGYRSIEDLAEAGGIGVLFADTYEDEDAPEKVDRQLRLKTREGEEIPVEAFLQSVPWNGGKALLLVLSRSREGGFAGGQSPLIAELEARVAEMRTIIDTATDGVVLISPDGAIRSISRPAEALFGFDSDDVVGKHFASLFAIESQRAARDYLAGLSENGVASVLNDGREVIGRESEGRFIPLFMTIGKLPNDSGYCAVVRDITQWKRAEEELTQARSVAERASSQKTDFLARVSHEIRTPLNAIIGFSELMMDEKFGPVANDRYRDYLRDINRSGNHVLDLVNDLLDISKIEAGQQEMAYEAVSLNDTLAETVAMMQPQANRERVIIRSSFASKLPDVVADLRSVRQIALNILSNAVRYTQAGGQVIVSTAYEAAGDVVMRVRDTGIGMSQPEIEQALKPFKQINSLKRARGDGTGLGLPLTKAMVEANRARFTINSTPGEGTLVEISFPSTRVLAD